MWAHICRRIYVVTMWDVNMAQCSYNALMFLGLKCAVFDPLRKRAESYLIKIVKYLVAWRSFCQYIVMGYFTLVMLTMVY